MCLRTDVFVGSSRERCNTLSSEWNYRAVGQKAHRKRLSGVKLRNGHLKAVAENEVGG
jgi:hypothetical protein